ncbi:uncharacterized protein LOC128740128 [Sabethes cyaneus]|uniref:uncharacterized protein LOC128740128 n=1 Tax=Sabethes cyaneus TaxID=53552 RepID=UPI00237D6B11|nr:uncharacterized protein LOC128740128 [Sabethes cyaneus]
MATERRIKALRLRQRGIQTSFSLIKTFVDEYNEDTDSSQVPVRLEHLGTLWADFNKTQMDLESADEAGIEQQFKHRTDFESEYYKVKGFLLSVNKTPLTPCAPSSSQSTGHVLPSASHVRLPDVKLPTFNGNTDNWLNFHDLYLSLVHSSAELSNIQKFYYLRSSLAGNALQLIQTIPISANNYVVAWNLLVEHYQNPVRLKQTYVDALFDFTCLKRESAADLHSLVEKFDANVRVLRQLGEQTQCWDVLLIKMLGSRLDPTTRRDWEEHASTKDFVTFTDLTTFIQRRVTVLQNVQSKSIETPPTSTVKRPAFRPVSSIGASQFNLRKCVMCSDHHPLYMCSIFTKMSIENKEREIRRHQLCRNCLRKGHRVNDCQSSSTCHKCRGRHHTQLCPSASIHSEGQRSSNASTNLNPTTHEEQQSVSAVSTTTIQPASFATSGKGSTSVLLATAVILLEDDVGNQHVARALLDSGSECCFITEALSQAMKVKRKTISLPIAGIGRSSTRARQALTATILSRNSSFLAKAEFLVLPRLTVDLPAISVDTSSWIIPTGIQLADPAFNFANPIDLILGAEIFFELFNTTGRIPLGDGLPILVNSALGWVVSGKTKYCQPIKSVSSNVATVPELHQLIERFWTLEEDQAAPCYSVEETACETHFQQTVSRSPEGRYIVRLPFKTHILPTVTNNRTTAIKRFHLLERRLAHDSTLNQQYTEFLAEYNSLGHMERIPNPFDTQHQCFHLPHHAVIRKDSSSTKVRVVFDGSCKSAGGSSLNEALMIGPVVQEDLRSIIMRSRINPIMLIADIKQMYRQVLLDDRDTPWQRIVWRSSPDNPLDTYELKTVTYGTASAPFLATRVLKQLAADERDNFPVAAEVLCRDCHVDDLFSGGQTIPETLNLRKQLETLLFKGGFQLRKWASNEAAVLQGIPEDNRALQSNVDFSRDQCIKTLGIYWEPAADLLRYQIQLPKPTTSALTKRIALSQIAQLFDPLGLVGPVVTTAKIYMQSLWALKDENGVVWDWDVQLPPAMIEQWTTYRSQLTLLNELKINRYVLCGNPTVSQLHIFSDASQNAYDPLQSTFHDGMHTLLDSYNLNLLRQINFVTNENGRMLDLCFVSNANYAPRLTTASHPLVKTVNHHPALNLTLEVNISENICSIADAVRYD